MQPEDRLPEGRARLAHDPPDPQMAGILENGIVNVVTGGQRQDAIAARLNSELLETEPAPEG